MDPSSGQISRNGETAQLEVRTLRLLLCLAERSGQVVSIDDLLREVWTGVVVSPDSVYQAVASLRRQLGDDSKQPKYIATVPRLGYRMVASVGPWEQTLPTSLGKSSRFPNRVLWAGAAVLLVVGSLIYGMNARRSHTEKSIAVLPFLDLTDKMSHEIFADGMTEEMIDKLSSVPGFRVPAPRTSFQLKGKKIPIAEVGRTLGVAYVLDGSIRLAGSTLRVSTRLVRADSGFVVWSETYERPWADQLTLQKAIAGEVSKAVKASLDSR